METEKDDGLGDSCSAATGLALGYRAEFKDQQK